MNLPFYPHSSIPRSTPDKLHIRGWTVNLTNWGFGRLEARRHRDERRGTGKTATYLLVRIYVDMDKKGKVLAKGLLVVSDTLKMGSESSRVIEILLALETGTHIGSENFILIPSGVLRRKAILFNGKWGLRSWRNPSKSLWMPASAEEY